MEQLKSTLAGESQSNTVPEDHAEKKDSAQTPVQAQPVAAEAKERREGKMSQNNDKNHETAGGDYIVVKAMENGVTVIGVTRGPENRFLHTEKLDEGEVWIAQFTEHVSAMKIRGAARIYTKHGELESDRKKADSYERFEKSYEREHEK